MSNSHGSKKNKDRVTYLLETGTVESARKAKRITADRVKFQYDHHAELARQRNAVQDALKESLIKASAAYEIEGWQRAVKYKYSLHPLSVLGSLGYVGGRFNMGQGINVEVPAFPGLYLAQDKDTALQEHLGQQSVGSKSVLTPREIALTHPASETIVSVSGTFDKIIDLTQGNKLKNFVNLIKRFTVSPRLVQRASALGMQNPLLITTVPMLLNTLLATNWRDLPSSYDVPANSQIFGHLVYSAGIEGILYLSKFTQKPCLVVFPRNFANTDSYVCLDDEPPHPQVPQRLDAINWRNSEMDLNEITSHKK